MGNYNGGSISVLLGNGDGTFQNQIKYLADIYGTVIVVGSFRNHARLDLAVVCNNHNNVRILFNSCP